jgi:hypothetical protein
MPMRLRAWAVSRQAVRAVGRCGASGYSFSD